MEVKKVINWEIIITGSALTIVLTLILPLILGTLGFPIAYLLGAMYAGYAVGGGYKNGVVYGGLVGAIITVIYGTGIMVSTRILEEFFAIASPALLLGVLGGFIGVFIKELELSKESTA